MKVKITLLIVCILFYNAALPQKIVKLNLTVSYKLNPFGYQSMTLYKGDYPITFIDTAKYSVLLKAQLHYQPYQFIWQNYKQGNYSIDTVNYIIKNYKVDTGKLYEKAINESVYVLVLFDKQTKDSLLMFNNILPTNISKWHKVKFSNISNNYLDINDPQSKVYILGGMEIYGLGKVITRPVYLFPVLDRASPKLIRQISFINSYYTSGYFEVKGKKTQVYIGNVKAQHFFDDHNTGIRIKDEAQKEKNQNVAPYQIGDTVNIDGKNYELYKVSPDARNIWIKNPGVSHKNIVGYNTGYLYQNFKLNDIVDNSQINSTEILRSKKYMLLDFWGTWCGPCIKGIPALREVHEKYNKDIEVISIAGEQKADTANVLSAIARYNMPWKHFMFCKNVEFNKELLLDQYRITAYPTYILINSEGVIVQRQIGFNGTDEIKNYLNKKLGY
jgi:thiol-disulfide isomerase/thioredoxin